MAKVNSGENKATQALTAGKPSPLGVSLEPGGANVAVVSQHATRIWVCLFNAEGETEIARLELPGRSGDVHFGFIAGLAEGQRYGLRADGPWQLHAGHRFDPAKLLVDPYAVELDGPFAYHSDLALPRVVASDTATLVPKAIARAPLPAPANPLPPQHPGLVYEIAVTAFTHRHPDVPPAQRGTVAALAEPAVIAHLKRIGADTIELMPLMAWIDERHLPPLGLHNAWGYNPVTFFAPDPRLAPGGITEIAATIAKLHAANIRVLLDVVFNHTGEGDDAGLTLSLRGLDNALYYRHSADDPGKPINDTGCGNTLALDRAPAVQLVMDALRHWARAGFDGFRFDLATILGRGPSGFSPEAPLLTAIRQDPELSLLTLIAEPWDVGPGGYQLGQFQEPWAEWNDRYRDDVRGFWRGDTGAAGRLATRLAGSSDIFAASSRPPSSSINFVAAHDGFPLADLSTYAQKHNAANGEGNRDGTSDNHSWNCGIEGPSQDSAILAHRHRDTRALLATLFLSRGTPMLTAGDEFGRTQMGNNNAYCQDNETTWLDWGSADAELIRYVALLSSLRRTHSALTGDHFLTGLASDGSGLPDAAWLTRDGSAMTSESWPGADVVGLALYQPSEGARPSSRLCLWFNRTDNQVLVTLPNARPGQLWRPILNSASATGAPTPLTAGGQLLLGARSVATVNEETVPPS